MPGFCSKIISHCSKTAVSRGLLSLLSHIPTDLVGSRVPGGVRSRVCSAENTNPYQSLIPFPSWVKPAPPRGTGTEARPLTQIPGFWWIQVCGCSSGWQVPAFAPPATLHPGTEETPSPNNQQEHPSLKKGGTAWHDQKGNTIRIEKQWPPAQQGQQLSPASLPRALS